MSFFHRKPKLIGDILSDVFARHPQKKKLKQGMAMGLWGEIVGEHIASQTVKLWYEGDRLFVKMKNPAWRHEVHLQRFTICARLNERVGDKVIEEIRAVE